jgi:hypothetical protein
MIVYREELERNLLALGSRIAVLPSCSSDSRSLSSLFVTTTVTTRTQLACTSVKVPPLSQAILME